MYLFTSNFQHSYLLQVFNLSELRSLHMYVRIQRKYFYFSAELETIQQNLLNLEPGLRASIIYDWLARESSREIYLSEACDTFREGWNWGPEGHHDCKDGNDSIFCLVIRDLFIFQKIRVRIQNLSGRTKVFLPSFRKRKRQHVCKHPDLFSRFFTYNTDSVCSFVHPTFIVLLWR